MAGNTFGTLFRITTWGESHGRGIGVVIDGCPPGLPIDESTVQEMLDRRKPGGSSASTARKEKDRAIILSGVFEGVTTGTPILIMAENKDADSSAYQPYADLFRPGHGDLTYHGKYGIRDWRGGGRASARETFARVAAGAVAKQLLEKDHIAVLAYTKALGGIRADTVDPAGLSAASVYNSLFCCPDPDAAKAMAERVAEVKKQGNSLGGIVEVRASGLPVGLGEPVFDKLDADVARALMSIGAVKGVEIGAGFSATDMCGSENNDEIAPGRFLSNNAGGILAGISNGDEILARAAVKPIPSIEKEQHTIDKNGRPATIATKGRHDISAIPRINVVCEAMMCLVLVDHLLRQKAIS
ncbi:MAG: chorismate synthase [Thermodesulfobacteriota bacterium]|nr:chorismate synthase [Thermodesulfobacteriota bacterium]